jgi:multimeric flavodoxin WrbA
MRITVVSGSPKGEQSVSLQYLRFIEKRFPEHVFTVFNVSHQIRTRQKDPAKLTAIIQAMAESDAVLFVTPVYYYLVPGQLVSFLELLEQAGAPRTLHGKYAAVITTSIHYFDHLAHEGLRGAVEDLGMHYVDFFSADMSDLEKPERREHLLLFAREFFTTVARGHPLARQTRPLPKGRDLGLSRVPPPAAPETSGKKIAIVADDLSSQDNLKAMVDRLALAMGPLATVVDLSKRDIKGGCLGCIECGLDNRCAYLGKDEVIPIYDDIVRAADIVVFATHFSGRFPSALMKNFMDRGFFHNHAPLLTGKQMAWLASGPLEALPHLREMMNAFEEMSQAGPCGVVSDDLGDADEVCLALDNLALRLTERAASGYIRPETFLSVGGRKLFRDDIYGRLRFVFQADHRYYKTHGLYDFPQKDLKTRLVNALFMTLSRIPAFRKKLRKMFKHKMVEPYKKIVDRE